MKVCPYNKITSQSCPDAGQRTRPSFLYSVQCYALRFTAKKTYRPSYYVEVKINYKKYLSNVTHCIGQATRSGYAATLKSTTKNNTNSDVLIKVD